MQTFSDLLKYIIRLIDRKSRQKYNFALRRLLDMAVRKEIVKTLREKYNLNARTTFDRCRDRKSSRLKTSKRFSKKNILLCLQAKTSIRKDEPEKFEKKIRK